MAKYEQNRAVLALLAESGPHVFRFTSSDDKREPNIEGEVTEQLCFVLRRNRMGREIIAMRADEEAMEKRYDEIRDFYGPVMFWSVVEMVGMRTRCDLSANPFNRRTTK